MIYPELLKKSLKIPKKVIRSRRWNKSDNTMVKRKRTKGHTLIYKTASPVLVLNTNVIRDFSYIRTNVVVRLPISSCKCRVRYIDIGYICKQEN